MLRKDQIEELREGEVVLIRAVVMKPRRGSTTPDRVIIAPDRAPLNLEGLQVQDVCRYVFQTDDRVRMAHNTTEVGKIVALAPDMPQPMAWVRRDKELTSIPVQHLRRILGRGLRLGHEGDVDGEELARLKR